MNSLDPGNKKNRDYYLPTEKPPRSWTYVIVIVVATLSAFLIWANWAEVDQISRAEGKVIPSGKTQIIQSAEPGVVSDILVRSGEQVSAGQLLIRLDDTNTASSAGEVEARVLALQAQTERLRIESQSLTIEMYRCPNLVALQAPEVCDAEIELLKSRLENLTSTTDVLAQRVEQRQREINELAANNTRLQNSLDITQQRLDLIAPMAQRGLAAQTDLLTLQAEVADITGQIAASEESAGRLAAALREAQLQVQQADRQFRQEALSSNCAAQLTG
jgi:adhesin transport system membrane fusion protein